MLVTIVIISVLASVALPYAELSVRRSNEYELKSALRKIRVAIDQFHEDWSRKKISEFTSVASDDGYPLTLDVLVQGVELKGTVNKKRYYLRRIPKNPFVDPTLPIDEQWVLRGYQDKPDALLWGRVDIYDVRAKTEKIAIDGTPYASW